VINWTLIQFVRVLRTAIGATLHGVIEWANVQSSGTAARVPHCGIE
jgi:hypothetical protein